MKQIFKIALLFSCFLSLFWCSAIAQDDSTSEHEWKNLTPKESKEAFEAYTVYLDEYYNWEFSEQEAYLSQGLNAALALQDDSLSFEFAYQLGNAYLSVDSFGLALEKFNKTVTLAYNDRWEGEAYNLLGYTYICLEDYETGLDYYFKAVEAKRKVGKADAAYVFHNIAGAYAELKDYQNAIKYIHYTDNLADYKSYPEREYILIYTNLYLSEFHIALEQWDSAKHHIDLTLGYVEKVDTLRHYKIQELVRTVHVDFIERYLTLGMNERAFQLLKKVKDYPLTYNKTRAIVLEAKYEMQLKNYGKALRILNDIETAPVRFLEKEKIIKLQIECYEATNNTKTANGLYKKLLTIQEDKAKESRDKAAILANAKYETFKKNEEIKSLRLDQKVKSLAIQNQRFVIALAVILAATLLGLFIFMRKRAQDRQNLSEYLQKEVDNKTQDLQKANTNLQKANEELRIMNYIASHDIKEPMRNIGNYLGLIKRKLPNETKPKVNEYFDIIQKSIKQLYTLVEDVATYINMSKEEAVNMEATDMNHLISSLFFSVDTYRQERNGVLQSDNLPVLRTSSTMIYVILKNLVENGLKYNQSETPTVKITYQETEEFHQIMVSDNGIGIEKAYHEQIFESFKRLHNRGEYKGSGIGLSIVKLLVEKLNGHVTIESEEGKGSHFIIQLPK